MNASSQFIMAILVLSMLAAAPADLPKADELPSQTNLPSPLVRTFSYVTSALDWRLHRNNLIFRFKHYMYGKWPDAGTVIISKDSADTQLFGGKATAKQIAIAVGPDHALKIHLLLVVPNQRTGPAPVFLGTHFTGNQTILNDPAILVSTAWMPDKAPGCKDNRATEASRGLDVNVWSIEDSIDRGYAVATFYCGDIAPDHPGRADGIFAHYPKPGPNDWGAVAAWAWGISRAVDYLITDPDLDRNKIAVVGHSRLGKAAILAAAFDERVALVIPHQAGCGGTAPSRGTIGESVKQINDRFPHWFCDEFKTFNTQTDRLPFDQNGLIALMAPRPVLLTNAVDDQWANPSGQFQALIAADPVYRLLAVEGLGVVQMPEVGVLIDTRLGYHIRPGKHFMGRDDWTIFRKFADKHFARNGSAR